MSIILRCGFKPVNLAIFRSKSLRKGKKLVESHHVSDVHEIKQDTSSTIKGTVLRETPGALSTRTKTNLYKPTIEVDLDRNIVDTDCSCKGGKGYCKHAAAICIFVSEENTVSKTDVPQTWNRPPTVQLELYHKGTEVENLWTSARAKRNNATGTFTDVVNVCYDHSIENVMQSKMMLSEAKCTVGKEARLTEEREKQDILLALLKKLYALQSVNVKRYSDMATSIISGTEENDINVPIKIKLTASNNYDENESFRINLSVDENQWLDIALKSSGQSGSSVWYKERFVRITASSGAHRIKTRVENFELLAENFVREKHNMYSNPAMRYGLEMEEVARSEFQKQRNCIVQEVGLIVCAKQPFLACSPDGIVNNGDRFELLEIKCPYICEKSVIIDIDKQQSFVPYLVFDENGNVQLKRSHVYYTQVQLSLYVLNIDVCNFFIYTKIDHVNIVIDKDEEFLSILIPKIEQFYFTYFFPLIQPTLTTNSEQSS